MIKELKAFYMAHTEIFYKLGIAQEKLWGLSPQILDEHLKPHKTTYAEQYDKAMAQLIDKKEEESEE